MTPHSRAGFAGQCQIGLEHLGVVEHARTLGGEQRAQPAVEPRRGRSLLPGDLAQRCVDAVEPAFGNGLAQRSLAREMAIDAAVAHIECTGNVNDGGLGKSVAPQDVLGHFEDPLRRQDNHFVHASTLFPLRAQLPGDGAASEAPLPAVSESSRLNEAVLQPAPRSGALPVD